MSGTIVTDTTWTLDQSPYTITADLTIANGATLTIQSGVTIYMASATNLVVQYGSLKVQGTQVAPVTITSDKENIGVTPVAGDWGTLQFQDYTSDFGTVLEHVNIKYGQGVVLQSCAPTFNYISISDQAGPAMSIDLMSSPAGIGNSAERNEINGVLVPAGDLNTNVSWKLQGIPFVIATGTLSVGRSPTIISVAPNQVSAGGSVDTIITGSRLTGAESVVFDDPAVTASLLSGATDTSLPIRVTASSSALLQNVGYEVQTIAGKVSSNASSLMTVTESKPPITVTSFSLPSLRRGESNTVYITGTQLDGVQVSTDSDLTVSDLVSTPSGANFTLTASLTAALGQHQLQFENPAVASGTAGASITVQKALPTVSVNPSALVLPANSTYYQFTVNLSDIDDVAHTFNVALADATVATVTPTSFTISAGQTQATLQVKGLVNGQTTLTLTSDGLATIEVPVYVTADFVGASTARAPLVGVEITPTAAPNNTNVPVTSSHVGVVLGSTITGIEPRNLTIGTGPVMLTISGHDLSAATTVSVVPDTGITLGSMNISLDGGSITLPVTIAADAPTTTRQVVVKAGTVPYMAVSPEADRIAVVLPPPQVESVQPQSVVRGSSSTTVTVRGQNLSGSPVVTVVPADGVSVGTASVSADGTQLTVNISVVVDAPVGDRLLMVTTSGGSSSSVASPANTFAIVNTITATYTPVTSTLLGVVKAESSTVANPSYGLTSQPIGITFGSAITQVTPRAGSVGQSVTLQFDGMNLDAVDAVTLSPATGVTVGVPSVAADGKSFTVNLDIASDAPQNLRKLQVMAGTNVVPFAGSVLELFQVAGPTAQIDSVSPLQVQTGASPVVLTLRGANFQGASEVRILPPDNMVVSTPPTVNADGTQVTVSVAAGAAAVTGPRTLVVTTPAGETSSTATAANTITVVSTVGATYTPVTSSLLGIHKLETPSSVPGVSSQLFSSHLGVVFETTPVAPVGTDMPVRAPHVGVGFGPVATSMSPGTFVQNSSGTITINGVSLDGVSDVVINPADGIMLTGPVTISPAGDQVSVPYSVSSTAPLTIREVVPTTASGTVAFTNAGSNRLRVTAGVPTIQSMTPIVFARGAQTGLTITGLNLYDASAVVVTPADGITVSGAASNASGTNVTVNITVAADAPLVARVVQVVTPGGTTSSTGTAANTFTLYGP